jgi:O-antigen ligase
MLKSYITGKSGVWSRRITTIADFILHQDELAATIIVAVHLYVDWYLGLAFVAQILTLALLLIIFLMRSSHRPWAKPRALWLWILFLILAIFPATHGLSFRDSAYYYFNVIFNALLIFWLGLAIAQDAESVRRLFKMLSIFAALLAIHTIIEAKTGVLLFKTMRYDTALEALSNFKMYGTNALRAQGFFLNPDTNGTFFAIILFLPLVLFIESSSFWQKLLYLFEMFLILLALLFTYSTGAWLATLVGLAISTALVGRTYYRILIPCIVLVASAAFIIFFPAQVANQIKHIQAPHELSLRFAAWQTGIQVIHSHPLTGLGLGRYVYITRAEPYRVLAQSIPLYHPQNAYLELAALGGLPVAILFLALLLFTVWQAFCLWIKADTHSRSLLAGGIATVIALSFNSLVAAGWTCPPLGAIGWLILGVMSSSFVMKNQLAAQAVSKPLQPVEQLSEEGENTDESLQSLER